MREIVEVGVTEVVRPYYRVKRGLYTGVMLLFAFTLGMATMLMLTRGVGVATASEIAQADDHLFPETGHKVPDIFYQYWQSHGGLRQQGYPITEARMEKNAADGKEYLTQYFERARFEHHPEFRGTENEVLLGLLGVEVLQCGSVSAGGTSSKDVSGSADFKFAPRPRETYIKEWCYTGFCPNSQSTSFEQDLGQSVTYHLVDEREFNADQILAFYTDTLQQAGWTVDKPFSEGGTSRGLLFKPPTSLAGSIKRASAFLYSDGAAGKLNALKIGVIRTAPTNGDLSLFVGH